MGAQTFNHPIYASEKTAARLLDMETKEFRELVANGALPPPTKITAGVERWRVADIDAILTGKAMDRDYEW